MRRILASSLVLSSLILPAAAKASTPVDDASAPTPTRVSTGVIFPALLKTVNVSIPEGFAGSPIPGDAQVGLTLTVDASGQPQNIRIVKPLNPLWDTQVVNAVSKFHFQAGTIDNQPVPVDLNLTVNIAR